MQDKPLPQATNVEETVIGTILAYPDSINSVLSILTPEMFYNSGLRTLYQVCIDLIQEGKAVDLINVSNKNGIGKSVYLTELAGRIFTDQMIENHALIIKEKYLLRQYILTGQELSDMAYTEDLADVARKAEEDLLRLSGLLHSKEPKKLCKLVDNVIDTINRLKNGEISLVGVPSGFKAIDRITGGFKRGELTIIAGRPSHGKTALALQLAKNTAEVGNQVMIFSCEMGEDEDAMRFLSGVSGYSNKELITGRCDIEKLLKTSESLLNLGIYIDDTSAVSLLELRAKTRKMILKHDIKVTIVDYLQLMSGTGQNREQEIASLSRGLKAIAKELDITVIGLSQLNRLAESRANKEPQLSDLRESGAIEQDADRVLLLYRPAYYKIDTIVVDGVEMDTKGLMIINMAKNRNGVTGEFVLYHNESMTMINETK
jgi:replicative DNA helicase